MPWITSGDDDVIAGVRDARGEPGGLAELDQFAATVLAPGDPRRVPVVVERLPDVAS
ncbi:hypothetical protein [Nonomuraea sp. CA-141351]|uniref:hypothetical protein n=1 Tax=Nonomuraea sp. CA-141351 TaxID=3239996 RepID=UPI003D943E3F